MRFHRGALLLISYMLYYPLIHYLMFHRPCYELFLSSYTNATMKYLKHGVLNYNRLNPNLNFENFVVGKSNKIAFLSAKKISSQLSRYNPLFIYGGVGLGKTHLINAIGLELKNSSNVMFISAERFMHQFIKSIKKNEMVSFKD